MTLIDGKAVSAAVKERIKKEKEEKSLKKGLAGFINGE